MAFVRVKQSVVPHWLSFAAHLMTFFQAATACHTELARRRPPARLTAYYFMMALGGSVMLHERFALIYP